MFKPMYNCQVQFENLFVKDTVIITYSIDADMKF